jgi:hypothetical protein
VQLYPIPVHGGVDIHCPVLGSVSLLQSTPPVQQAQTFEVKGGSFDIIAHKNRQIAKLQKKFAKIR